MAECGPALETLAPAPPLALSQPWQRALDALADPAGCAGLLAIWRRARQGAKGVTHIA